MIDKAIILERPPILSGKCRDAGDQKSPQDAKFLAYEYTLIE